MYPVSRVARASTRVLVLYVLPSTLPRRKSATGLPPELLSGFLVYRPLKLKLPPCIRALTLFVCIHCDSKPNLTLCWPLIQLVSLLICRFCPLDQTGSKFPAPRLVKPDMLIVGYVTLRFDGGACRPIFAFTLPSASASGEKLIKNSSLNHPALVVVISPGESIAVQVRPVP